MGYNLEIPRLLSMIDRVEQAMNRPDDYDYLLCVVQERDTQSRGQGFACYLTMETVGHIKEGMPSFCTCHR